MQLDSSASLLYSHSRDSGSSHVLVVDGFGVSLTVSRGHLQIRDGLGHHRRERRLTRSQREVTRIVVLGHTGHISLEAIRWCADTGLRLVALDPQGDVLLTAGPHGTDDARLRRAQAAAANNRAGLDIARLLLGGKVVGQAAILENQLGATRLAATVRTLGDQLGQAEDIVAMRDLEAKASSAYFGGWSAHAHCQFAERDQTKVPDHWSVFGSRRSQINRGSSPRNAANPINALLNYGYALAEAECHFAVLAVGLDPGVGIVHTDSKNRDSLVLDLLEPLRPTVERHVLELLAARRFRAEDFHETPQGVCRLLPALTAELAARLPVYAREIATPAEAVAHILAGSSPNAIQLRTPLSRANYTSAQTKGARAASRRTPTPTAVMPSCRSCGALLADAKRQLCDACWSVTRTQLATQRASAGVASLKALRAAGADPTQTPEARDKRKSSLVVGKAAEAIWRASGAVTQISEADFVARVSPALGRLTLRQLQEATGLSVSACSMIRSGKRRPHARHWDVLAALVRDHLAARSG